MFIENLRHVKNKGRVWFGILLGLIVISLLASFGFMGRNVTTNGEIGASTIDQIAAKAENMGKAADKSKDDMQAQSDAAAAYLNLAAFNELYLEDANDAYAEALNYGKAMVTACGKAKAPDYNMAYGYEISACSGLGNAEQCSAAFNESLSFVDITEEYLNSYYSAMSGMAAGDQFSQDMNVVLDILEKQADAEEKDAADKKDKEKDKKKADKDEAAEDADAAAAEGEEEEASAEDLIQIVKNLMMQSRIENAQ